MIAVVSAIAQSPMTSMKALAVKMNGTMKTVDNLKTQSIKTMVAKVLEVKDRNILNVSIEWTKQTFYLTLTIHQFLRTELKLLQITIKFLSLMNTTFTVKNVIFHTQNLQKTRNGMLRKGVFLKMVKL